MENAEMMNEEVMEEPKTFEIKDDQAAEWALKKIAQARKERDRLTALADSEILSLQEQKRQFAERCDNDTSFLTNALQGYFNGLTDVKATKTQESYKLLSGKLVHKFGAIKPQYEDADLLQWLKANKDLDHIKVVEKPDWAGLKKTLKITEDGVFTKDGEIIECITAVRQPDTFAVEVD